MARIAWRDRARLRPRELAEIAGVSVRTIHRAIARREIESYREGAFRFVPVGAALAWLGEQEPGGTGAAPRVSPEARAFLERMRG